jgi:hypothetical protein
MFLVVPRAELGDMAERQFLAVAQTHVRKVPFMLC